jgi:hypothetical protein
MDGVLNIWNIWTSEGGVLNFVCSFMGWNART